MRSLDFAAHTAYLDEATGSGLLVRPLPCEDVADPLEVGTLHAADWTAAVRHLLAMGWEPSEDECGDLVCEGFTSDGREVLGLCGFLAVAREDIPEQARAFQQLRVWVGLA